jgi:hypothetical protein
MSLPECQGWLSHKPGTPKTESSPTNWGHPVPQTGEIAECNHALSEKGVAKERRG